MESSGDAFDAFFTAIVGGAFGSQDSAAPSSVSRPPRAPSGKGKSQGTSQSGSRGTPRSKKRKFGMMTAFPEDLRAGELDPVSNKDVSHLARCFYYSAESVTPEVAEETDKMSLSQRYGQALRATQEASYLLSHCLPDLDSLIAARSEVDKLKGELQSRQSREDQLAQEVKSLHERIADLSGEKARVENDRAELQATNEELLSRQKTIAQDAFSPIMSEVWSVDPELEVPCVQKFVNKATVLKTIAERRKPSQSGASSGTPGAPHEIQPLPVSDVPKSAVPIPGTSESSASRLPETDICDDAPPSA